MSSNNIYYRTKEYAVETGQIQQGKVLEPDYIQNVYGTAVNTVVKYNASKLFVEEVSLLEQLWNGVLVKLFTEEVLLLEQL